MRRTRGWRHPARLVVLAFLAATVLLMLPVATGTGRPAGVLTC
ncbi:hypothetical protein [Saccharothrix deserti]|nr:hypothetical protein [Saccharothrix deserti]